MGEIPQRREARVSEEGVDPIPERRAEQGTHDLELARAADSAEHRIPTRLRLQRGAPDNLRRQVARAVRRFLVLLGGDVATFLLIRSATWAVREGQVLGPSSAGLARVLVPAGTLEAWPFLGATVLALLVTGNYGQGHDRRSPTRLFVGCALAAALPLWASAGAQGLAVAVARYGVLTGALWAGFLIERLTLDRLVALVIPPARHAARTLFVGAAVDCRDAQTSATFQPRAGYRSIGFVDLHVPPGPGALGSIAEFPVLLQRAAAETVVVSGHLPSSRLTEVVDAALAAGCELLAVPRALEVAGVEPTPVWRQGQVLIKLTTPRLRGHQYLLKGALDLAVASVGLVVLAPLFAIVALLVKLDSPGPVFYGQRRVGLAGRLFRIIKFRTMRPGAEQQRADLLGHNIYGDTRLFKMERDPRVTRVGRWLRRLSLDELPQLLNVVRGEMSLVGPRPPLPSEVALYEAHHYARFDVKPGITGPWQVSGRNEITDFERVLSLETQYIREWSLGQDLWILWRTVPAVLARRGAH